uniref:Thaumatin-like protein n=1 Tax=Rhabditophanes sp. KR3021 TaxID=114890 RepID=A0AC35UB22_9BILA
MCIRPTSSIRINIVNNCVDSIWPVIVANKEYPNEGFKLEPNESNSFYYDDEMMELSVFARTGCDNKFECQTGSCGHSINCTNYISTPISIANLKIDHLKDTYKVDLNHGFNKHITIEPNGHFLKSNKLKNDCETAGKCLYNIKCPDSLVFRNYQTNLIGCYTGKLNNKNLMSCSNRNDFFNIKDINNALPCDEDIESYYSFKGSCPTSYFHSVDGDKESIFHCYGRNKNLRPNYKITFSDGVPDQIETNELERPCPLLINRHFTLDCRFKRGIHN